MSHALPRLGWSTAEFAEIVGISDSLLKLMIQRGSSDAPKTAQIASRRVVIEAPSAYLARMAEKPAKLSKTPRSPGRPRRGESDEEYAARVQALRDQRTERAS